MKITLSKPEIKALRQIRNSIMHSGKPPSVRELMKKLDYSSPRSVSYLFEKLEQNILDAIPVSIKLAKPPHKYDFMIQGVVQKVLSGLGD